MIRQKMNLSILLVEDEEPARATIFRMLSKRVSIVYEASNGKEGYELYKKYKPDIVLTDINMPIMTGIEMIRAIKDEGYIPFFVVMSAHSESKYLLEAISLKVNDYLTKPISIERLSTILENVDETLSTKRQLEENNVLLNQYKKAVDKSAIISKTDINGVITYVNDRFCFVSGYTKDELIGLNHNIVRHPEMSNSVFSEMWETILSKKIWKGVIKNRTKEGNYTYLDTTIVPFLAKDGSISEFMSIRYDITDLVENEQMILKQKYLFELILESQNSLIAYCDDQGTILKKNSRFEEFFQLVDNVYEVFNIDDFILENKNKTTYVREGEKFHFLVDCKQIAFGDKDNVVVSFYDVTKEEELLSEIEAMNKDLQEKINLEIANSRQKDIILQQQSSQASMGEMVGAIAHQWRQPLNSINIEALNIQTEVDLEGDPENIKKYAKNIIKLSKNMSKVITDFMEFSRPNPDMEEFSLKEAIENVRVVLEVQVHRGNVKFIDEIDDTIFLLHHKNYLQQVVMNIVNNAIQAFKPEINDRFVKISSLKDDNTVLIIINDNAGGVPQEILDKMFEPYFTTKPKGIGTGLGLSICKTIVEKSLEGQLLAKNTDVGLEMTIVIPLKIKDETSHD